MLWDEDTDDLVLTLGAELYFYDAAGGEHIKSDGTDMTIYAGADLVLSVGADVNIPTDKGLTFGDDGQKIESDGTDFTIASGADLNLTTTGDVVFDVSGNSQLYNWTDRGGSLVLQGQSTNTFMALELYTKDGNLDDALEFTINASGLPGSVTNRVAMVIGYNTIGSNHFQINTDASGSGTALNFALKDDGTAWLTKVAGGEIDIAADIDLNNNDLLNPGGANNEWTTEILQHYNQTATATNAVAFRASDGGGGFSWSPFTSMSAGQTYFIQDWEIITLTGSDPTTYTHAYAHHFQGIRYIADEDNQTITKAYTMYLEPPTVSSAGAGAAPAITTAATLYISAAASGGTITNNYALWVDAGSTRLDGSLWVEGTPTEGAAGEQLQSAGTGAVPIWAAASSLGRFKDTIDVLSPEDALDKIISWIPKSFRYKADAEISTHDYDTTYVGVYGEDAPEVMHYEGRIFNPVSAFGYTVGAIQELHNKIQKLETQLAAS
jgi:hypothetical protein